MISEGDFVVKKERIFLSIVLFGMLILIILLFVRKTYSFNNVDIKFGYEINGDNYLKISEKIRVINDSIILVSETSIEDFMNNLSSNGNVRIYDLENNLLETGKLKTGNKLIIDFSNESLEYKISVLGDLTTDGIVDKNDIMYLSKYILSHNILDDVYLYAGDIDINNTININDVIKLVKYFNGDYIIDSDNNESISVISFPESYDEIYLNSSSSELPLTVNINSSNAANQNLIWTSSNNEVATISSNGIVTAKNLGITKITVTTEDGKFNASMDVAVRKKIVIIIGASQVTRMKRYKNNYDSINYKYDVDDGTLIYVEKSGSGIEYQYNDGFTTALGYINDYEDYKDMVDFYVYFPLSGNTIKDFTCNNSSNSNSVVAISSDNSYMNEYVLNYNEAIKSVSDMGYNIIGYIVSMHPVNVSQRGSNNYVVYNESSYSCNTQYRSNWKYYVFNNAIEEIINSKYSESLNYISLFSNIMETNNNGKNFSFKTTYNTTDGIHWDEETTINYVDMMLKYSGKL